MLKLYNTLTRKKEDFKPIKDKIVGLYTCGPTVYNFAHIGNLRTYIFEDILIRILLYNGFKVNHVINITDVGHLVSDADVGEDKMMQALKREGLPPTEKSLLKLAKKYTQAFKKDISFLNVFQYTKNPNYKIAWCQATEHVKDMIKLIKEIERNGYAYQTSDGLYFDTAKFKNYGQLARLDFVGLQAGARVEENPEKKNPTDFALWLKAVGKNKNHVMQWDSPWERGFPGWHIECSAMSMKYLGQHFDIHCGGVDHISVHHTNEIAQNEGAASPERSRRGKKSVNFWLHGEFLVLSKEKMAKSADGFITLQKVINQGICPLAFRYLSLQTHYRQKLMFSWPALKAAENALNNLYQEVAEMDKPKIGCAEYEEKFLEVINDDLNIPKALGLVWDLIKDKKLPSSAKKQTLLKFDQVLGLGLDKIKKLKIPKEVEKLVKVREKLRKQKQWQKADEIRKEIEKLGFIVKDTPERSKLKLKRG